MLISQRSVRSAAAGAVGAAALAGAMLFGGDAAAQAAPHPLRAPASRRLGRTADRVAPASFPSVPAVVGVPAEAATWAAGAGAALAAPADLGRGSGWGHRGGWR